MVLMCIVISLQAAVKIFECRDALHRTPAAALPPPPGILPQLRRTCAVRRAPRTDYSSCDVCLDAHSTQHSLLHPKKVSHQHFSLLELGLPDENARHVHRRAQCIDMLGAQHSLLDCLHI
jgi:hypothetical protein